MKCLQLNSGLPSFAVLNNEQIGWEIPIEFDSQGRIALVNMTMVFKTPKTATINVRTNIIEDDMYNYDGLLLSRHISNKTSFQHKEYMPLFWNVDSARPRIILFTLEGVKTGELDHIAIILAIE